MVRTTPYHLDVSDGPVIKAWPRGSGQKPGSDFEESGTTKSHIRGMGTGRGKGKGTQWKSGPLLAIDGKQRVNPKRSLRSLALSLGANLL